MIGLARQAIMQVRVLLGGATATSVSGALDILPQGFVDATFLSSGTSIAGVAVPSYLLYLIFFTD